MHTKNATSVDSFCFAAAQLGTSFGRALPVIIVCEGCSRVEPARKHRDPLAPGITTRNKDATRSKGHRPSSVL